MPIFEMDQGSLLPFKRQAIEAGVYEVEIEGLLWDNLEELTGDNLFRVARQATLPSGGRPDVVALDDSGRVVVVEVKRDVDRHQLAQALEYAGWARTTNLDALASMYHGGPQAFWEDWTEFTGTAHPVLVQRNPRLVLVARSFAARTAEALEFLLQHQLPVQVLKVAFYVDDNGRRFLDVEWESEPESAVAGASVVGQPKSVAGDAVDFREVTLAEVASAVGTPRSLTWNRPRKGTAYSATLLEGGVIRLDDGREFRSPSGAAMAAADVVSYDGWYAWRTEDGKTLNEHRHAIADAQTAAASKAPGETEAATADGFYEKDEPVDQVVEALGSGAEGVTSPN